MKRNDKLAVLGMALYGAVVFCMFLAWGLNGKAAEVPKPAAPVVSAGALLTGNPSPVTADAVTPSPQSGEGYNAAYVDPDMGETDPGTEVHIIENCIITYYCAERYPHICGTGDGLTATGEAVTPGVTCAVDPAVIPYGSTVSVDYGDGVLHEYLAQDTGVWVTEAHVDICVDRHDTALELGRKTATVYWTSPEEDVWAS